MAGNHGNPGSGMMDHLQNLSLGTAIFIFLTAWVIYTIFIRPFLSPLRKIPGRPYIPILGNSREISRSEALTNTIRWMQEHKSPIVRFYLLFGRERLLVADPASMKQILVTNSKNYVRVSPGLEMPLSRVMKGSLLTTSGEEHHAQRRLCNLAFRKAVLTNMIPTFEKHANKLVKFWASKLTEAYGKFAEVPVQMDIPRMTLDIICETAFDYPINSIDNPNDEEVKAVRAVLSSFSRDILKTVPFYQSLPLKANKQFKKNKDMLDLLVKSVMKRKRTSLHGSDPDANRDLLTNLITARDDTGASLEESEIQSHVISFLFAGHETTSVGLTWALKELSENPEIQTRLREEVNTVLVGQDLQDETITAELLDRMPYLNCVVKETLRFLPPVLTVWRKSLQADTVCGYKIPAGTVIGMHFGTMMRLPQFWEEPETFKPERFLSDKTIDPYSFLPFGAGAHMCIGHRFAVLEMSTVLCVLLRNFNFEAVPGIEYKRRAGITMKPSPPLELRVRPL